MKAIELLRKLCKNFMNIEATDIVTIDQENAPASGWFPIDECHYVEDGEYMYTYLNDEEDVKQTERLLGKPFTYAIPCKEGGWVGLMSVEE